MSVDVGNLVEAVIELGRERAAAIGESFVVEAQAGAPFDTGALHESIEAEDPVEVGRGMFQVRVFCGAEYGRYQDEGTGVYGPSGTPIRPTSAKVLVFPGSSGVVFATEVSGSPPTLFWQRALASWSSIVAAA